MSQTDSGFLEELRSPGSTSVRTISIENIIRRQIRKLKRHRDDVELELWTACKIDGEQSVNFETEISFLLSALGGLLQVIVTIIECFNNTSAIDCDTTFARNTNSHRCKFCRAMNKVIDDNVKRLKKRLQKYLVTVMAPNLRSKNERFSSERQELSKLLRQLQCMHDIDDSSACSDVIEDVMKCFGTICGMSNEFGVIKGELDMVDNVKQVIELLDTITGALQTDDFVQRDSKRYLGSSLQSVDPNVSTVEAAASNRSCTNRENEALKQHMSIILESRDYDDNNIASRRNSIPLTLSLQNVNSNDNVTVVSETCKHSNPLFNNLVVDQRPINPTDRDHLHEEIENNSIVACSRRGIQYFTSLKTSKIKQDPFLVNDNPNTHSEEPIAENNISCQEHNCHTYENDHDKQTVLPEDSSVLKDACSKLKNRLSNLKQSDTSSRHDSDSRNNHTTRKINGKKRFLNGTPSSLDEQTVYDKQRFISASVDDVYEFADAEDLSDYSMLPSTSAVVTEDSMKSPYSGIKQIGSSIHPATFDNESTPILGKGNSSNDPSDNFMNENRKATTVHDTNQRTSICNPHAKHPSENTPTDTQFNCNSNRQCMSKRAPPINDDDESRCQSNKPTPYQWTIDTKSEKSIFQPVIRQYREHGTSESTSPEEHQIYASCSENSKPETIRSHYDRMLTDARRRNDEYVFQNTLEALQNNESIGGIPRYSRSLSDSCLAGLLDNTVDYQTNAAYCPSDHGDTHFIKVIIVSLVFLGVALLLMLSSCKHGNLLSLYRPPIFYSVFEVLQDMMELRHLENPAI